MKKIMLVMALSAFLLLSGATAALASPSSPPGDACNTPADSHSIVISDACFAG